MSDLVALTVLHDQLKLIGPCCNFVGHRKPVLNMEVAAPAAATIIDVRKLSAADSFPLAVEYLVGRTEQSGVALFCGLAVVVFDLDIQRYVLPRCKLVGSERVDGTVAVNVPTK